MVFVLERVVLELSSGIRWRELPILKWFLVLVFGAKCIVLRCKVHSSEMGNVGQPSQKKNQSFLPIRPRELVGLFRNLKNSSPELATHFSWSENLLITIAKSESREVGFFSDFRHQNFFSGTIENSLIREVGSTILVGTWTRIRMLRRAAAFLFFSDLYIALCDPISESEMANPTRDFQESQFFPTFCSYEGPKSRFAPYPNTR